MAASGFVLWGLVSELTRHREAWDSSLYWFTVPPVLAVVAAILGFALGTDAIQLGVAAALGQAAGMMVWNPRASWGLLPFTIILLGFLSLPSILAAALAAAVRRRLNLRRPINSARGDGRDDR